MDIDRIFSIYCHDLADSITSVEPKPDRAMYMRLYIYMMYQSQIMAGMMAFFLILINLLSAYQESHTIRRIQVFIDRPCYTNNSCSRKTNT